MATTSTGLHHAQLLTNYAQDWRPPEEGWYVADELFPMVSVGKEFDDFLRINASTWRQTANAVVGPSGDVSRVGFYRDADGSYKAKPYALEGVIDLKERAAADDVLQYEQLCMEAPLRTLWNTLEEDALREATTVANLGTSYENVAGADMFDNLGATSNPTLYVERKCALIKRKTGRKVNMVVIDDLVWRAWKWHPTTQQIFPGFTVPGVQVISPAMLEEKLSEVMEKGAIRVMSFRKENARPPVATGSEDLRSLVGPHVIMARVEKNPSLADWSAFKCFSWTGNMDPETGAQLVGGDPKAPIGVYTYPKPDIGQRGSIIPKVLCNRHYKVTRLESLYVARTVVDTTNTSLFGTELT